MSDGGGFDGRKERRSKVVPFVSYLERDRKKNLANLRALAEELRDHITNDPWEKNDWNVSSPGLLHRVGRNRNTAVLFFSGQKQIGGQPIGGDFNTLAKALVVLRYHRNSQSIENQRSFITAVSYVEWAANGSDPFQLTEEHLNLACDEITKDYKEGSAYNLHKAVGELGFTPKPRTVVKGWKTSSPAWRPVAASSGCGTARCIRTHPLLPHRVSGTSCDRSVRA